GGGGTGGAAAPGGRGAGVFRPLRGGAFCAAGRRGGRGQPRLSAVLLGLGGAGDEPIGGGRHKVFGSHALAIPPQTSTIASHLPKAVGAAVALDRAARLRVGGEGPGDPVIVCTLRRASAKPPTATRPITTAAWAA